MANLTRILNNQITNSTIIASQKIAAGTIVGSLFASNVTVPGDLLITGNLFVLGNSVQTTIASTNTYVNDPLLTLNNGFTGTNTYDEGLIFNRGSSTNQAFIWSETYKEFRVVSTTETGTTYGNINATGLANLSVGSFVATGIGNISTLYSATATILNAYHTTLNVTGNVLLGLTQAAAINATPIGNITQASGQFTTLSATASFYANAGTPSTSTSTGAAVVIGGVGVAGNIYANSIYLSAGSVSSGVYAGAYTDGIVLDYQTGMGRISVGSNDGITLYNNTDTTRVALVTVGSNGNLTAISINATPIGNVTPSTGVFTVLSANQNLWANASIATTAQGIGAVVVPNGGISVAGAANIALGTTIGGATQINNTLGVGGVTSITNTTNATGASTGALQVAGGASFSQDVWIGGNLFVSNIIGVQANIITVTDPLLYLRNSNVSVYNYDIGFYSAFTGTGLGTINQYQHTAVFRNPLNNTWNFVSNLAEPSASYITIDSTTVYDPIKAGNLQLTVTTDSINATTGALIVAGGAGIGGNIFQTGAYHDSSSSNFIHMPTPTTANNFASATTIFYGAPTGDFVIRNQNISTVQTGTVNLLNANVTTLNFAGAATTISVGAATGTTTFNSATNGATYRAGAVVISGGVGVNGNLNLSRSNYITLGADLNSNIVYPENSVQVTTTSNASSRISIQNTNTGLLATSEFNVISSNGSNTSAYMSVGITGQNYQSASAPILKPQDGYTYTSTGNLILASAKDILMSAGGLTAIDIIVSNANGNVGVQNSTAATSSTTGALTSVGGISTQANLYTGTGATINTNNGIEGFTVKSSKSGNVAIFANVATQNGAATESVIIGGGNLAVQPGVLLKVSGVTSMMVPVGPTSARPSSILGAGYDAQGMIRFNTTSTLLEYYDGTQWQAAGSAFTVISDRQFQGNVPAGYGNVDGTNTTFTIQSNSTTAGTLVSINGVMQFPVLAYSVSGTTLTFTEPPAPTDIIDVRVLTTTTSVTTISSANGLNQLIADTTGVSLWSGTSATTERILVDPVGNFNILTGSKITYTQTPTNIPTTATPVLIDSWSQTAYTSATYEAQAKVGSTNMEVYNVKALTDGAGNAFVSVYGVINNGTTFGTFSANVGGGNVNVYYTSSIAQANVKAFGTYIV